MGFGGVFNNVVQTQTYGQSELGSGTEEPTVDDDISISVSVSGLIPIIRTTPISRPVMVGYASDVAIVVPVE